MQASELKGKTIGGRTITPHIYIPYYDTSLFVTPTWDGATVYRVVLNDPFAKQNIGVPVKIWNGTAWTDSTYKDAQIMMERLHWVVEFGELPDGLRPFAKCICYSCNHINYSCVPGDCAGFPSGCSCSLCGFTIFGGCLGVCHGKIGFIKDL